MQEYEPDDVDFALMHALQIEPRAPWKALAPVLGVDPVTLARRYHRLRENGLIWITGYDAGSPGQGAVVEIDCAPGEAVRTAESMAQDSTSPQADGISCSP